MTVEESVFQCNRLYGHLVKSRRKNCPNCGKDEWRCRWGINPEYRSKFNPGEYIQYTCAHCGHVGPELPS